MNYKKHYANLIKKRLRNPITEGYTEKHHIHPVSLGGKDEPKNLINLTPKEHFIAHLLLTKMYKKGTRPYYKMIKAFGLMCWCQGDTQDRYISSNEYAWLREEFSKAQSLFQQGESNSNYGSAWYYSEELRKSKKFQSGEEIPEGWVKGRVLDFDVRDLRTREKEKERFERLLISTKLKEFNRVEKIIKYTKWYEIYDKVGFKEFCKVTEYQNSHANLLCYFMRYVSGYSGKGINREFKDK